jgi:sugar phosphate isomerase/epimerase
MTRPVYVSSTSFESTRLEDVLALCERGRVEALELSVLDGWDPRAATAAAYPRHFIVHNYFPAADPPFVLNLASQDDAVLERSREFCRAAIDLSHTLGSPVYAAHAGYTADLAPSLLGDPVGQSALAPDVFAARPDAYETLVDSVRALCGYAAARDVRFLIENHVLSAQAGERGAELLLMVTADELLQLAGDVGDPRFGVLADVGHLKVSAGTLGFDPNGFLDRLAPLIAAFHLSDNDGVVDSHSPFDDDAWFLPKLRGFPEAAVTLELQRQPLESITDARDTVARWL